MIWIDPYYRLRFGRVEYVRGHWRYLPLALGHTFTKVV